MPNPLSQDILSSADAVERARSAIRRYNANQQYLDALRRRAPEIGRPDPMKLEAPPELDPDQVVADVMFGKGTGSLAKDILLGFTGGFAGPATEAMGGQSGVLDWVPGGGIVKAGILGLIKAGKKAEARAVANILSNPIANRFANRYPEEAVKRLSQFVEKHPTLKNMNTAEVYDVMQSGHLGEEFFVDLGKDYPEAMASVFSHDADAIVNNRTGQVLTWRDLLERLRDKLSPSLYNGLSKGLDMTERAVQSGDYETAFRLGSNTQNAINLMDDVIRLQPNLNPEQMKRAEDYVISKLDKPRVKKSPTEAFIEADPMASLSQKNGAERIDEYIHLQADPISDWQRTAYLDENGAALMEKMKAEQEAAKQAAMERKAAAEASKQDAAYAQRLKLFNKNPKKAMKDANSAAPPMIRKQGDAAVREWYFGRDPLAKEQPVVVSAPAPEPVIAQPEPVPQAARVMDIAEPAVEEAPVAVGGPNKWRENGWKSEEHPLSGGSYESLVGKGANEEDRRAAFVLDSLMNDAVAGLYRNKAMWWKKANGDIGFAKSGNHELKPGEVKLDYGGDWNDFRHKAYNYDQQRLKLSRDLRENLATGNMPKSSRVILEDAYNMRTGNRIPGASRARVNGMDTYEWLFRPMVTEKILKDTPEYMGGFKK